MVVINIFQISLTKLFNLFLILTKSVMGPLAIFQVVTQ